MQCYKRASTELSGNVCDVLSTGENVPGYHIMRHLGRGSCAEVVMAIHEGNDKAVALKVALSSAENPIILNEIAAHNIVGDLGYIATMEGNGEINGRLFIATRLQEMGTMDDMVVQDVFYGRLPSSDSAVSQRMHLFENYAAGISMLNTVKGLLHRDIKLNNLGVSSRGVGRILDLGLACRVDDLAQAGIVCGTSGVNIAPEGYLGETSPASEVWALGAAAYRAFTLSKPFPEPATKKSHEGYRRQALTSICVSPRVINPALPSDASDAIVAALAPAPEDRPHITEMQRAFGV